MYTYIVTLSIFILCLCSQVCAQQTHQQARDLYAEHCLNCHSTSITCLHLDRDKAYWTKTIKRMYKKSNQFPEAEDLEILVDFLTNMEPGAAPVCN